MISGVIFDMDGLMIDTERLCVELWCQVLVEQGMPPHRELALHCMGLDHGAMRKYLGEMLGGFDYMAALSEVGRRSEQYCREHGVPVKRGLYALLHFLDTMKIPYGVATSTRGENARRRLRDIGVLDHLSALITGDMVTHGKPQPEIFQRAAEALALPPERCLVLEDSPHGILAAHGAGCLPMMIPDLQEPRPEILQMLHARGDSLYDVIPVLQQSIFG